jgi:hypothetical protein
MYLTLIDGSYVNVIHALTFYMFVVCSLLRMTQMEFWGCSFIAFGLPLAMFVFTVAKDPLRIIVFVARYRNFKTCMLHAFSVASDLINNCASQETFDYDYDFWLTLNHNGKKTGISSQNIINCNSCYYCYKTNAVCWFHVT